MTTETTQTAPALRMLVDPAQVAEARKQVEALLARSGLALEPFAVAGMAMRAEQRAALTAVIKKTVTP